MSQPIRNLRHALKSLVPIWLSDRSAFHVGFTILYIFALVGDLLIEAMFQGFRAPQPGRGTPTALSLIGNTRGMIRSVNETDDAYATRLQGWLDMWATGAGTEVTLVKLIQAVLGGNLVIRHINRKGHFVTANADGSISLANNAAWNWDNAEFPSHSTWWSDAWIVVYVPTGQWAPYPSFASAAWLASWKSGLYGCGHQIPRNVVDSLRQILHAFTGAHTFIEAVIFTNRTTLFDPANLGLAGNPDGTWGNWSTAYGHSGEQEPTRDPNVVGGTNYMRFMTPYAGGQ